MGEIIPGLDPRSVIAFVANVQPDGTGYTGGTVVGLNYDSLTNTYSVGWSAAIQGEPRSLDSVGSPIMDSTGRIYIQDQNSGADGGASYQLSVLH